MPPIPSYHRAMVRTRLGVLAASLVLLSLPALAFGQGAADAPNAFASRETLVAELGRLETEGGAASHVALLRRRLAEGDFQPGDRIAVIVDGEPELSDTFNIRPGPILVLPQVGEVPLDGVLRAEVHDRVAAAIARLVREPVVRTRPLLRVLIEGSVVRPGFYSVPPDVALADIVTIAGGLTSNAQVSKLEVRRGSDRLWGGGELQDALGRGATLDQLSLQAGDRLYVPSRGDFERTTRIFAALVTIPISIYAIVKLF